MLKLGYRNYLLVLLIVAGVATNFERFVFSLVLEPIKNELHLSDGQLGLMTGMAFFAFYALAGIPIARWADRGNRVTITTMAVGLCGVMVSLCGMASSFFTLLFVRAGVAIGEAGVIPAGQSLLSDYFNRAERPRILGFYISFYSISMIIGFLLGGWLVESLGWRLTFMVIGLPGLLVAILVKTTLVEPRLENPPQLSAKSESLFDALALLWQQRTFRKVLILFCLGYFFNAGVSQWLPTFLIRTYDMSMSEVGAWLALAFGGFGTFGVFLGGHLASRYAAHREKFQMRILALTTITYGLLLAFAYLAKDKYISIVFISLAAVFMMANNGPLFAAIQSLVKDHMRSLAVATTFMFGNLIGLGFGPLVLGLISDALHPSFGQDSLRYAMLAFCPGTFLMALYFWNTGETIEEDIQSVNSPLDSNNQGNGDGDGALERELQERQLQEQQT